MHKLMELKEKLCEMLEQYEGKEVTANSLEAIDKLAHAIKNLGKIIEMYEEEEYSERGGSYARGGNRGGGRRGGNSRASGGSYGGSYEGSYEGGSYGGSYARGGRGGYSREYSRNEDMIAEPRELMNDAPEEAKGEFRKFIGKIENMR